MKRSLQLNPANQLASWEHIKTKRNELEVSPITVGTEDYDADRDSILRMDQALSAFDVLPTLNAEGKLGWKTFDNQVVLLTKAQLTQVREEIAKRAALLHYNASVLHAAGTYLVKELDNTTLWGL